MTYSVCNGSCDALESTCGFFLYNLYLYFSVYIYTHMHVYTYKCIYTYMHVYLSTVYIFYKHTHSLYIRNPREIIFQEHDICFPPGKHKLVHFLDIPSDIFSLHLFHRPSLPLHFCEVIEICPSAVGSIIPLS